MPLILPSSSEEHLKLSQIMPPFLIGDTHLIIEHVISVGCIDLMAKQKDVGATSNVWLNKNRNLDKMMLVLKDSNKSNSRM